MEGQLPSGLRRHTESKPAETAQRLARAIAYFRGRAPISIAELCAKAGISTAIVRHPKRDDLRRMIRDAFPQLYPESSRRVLTLTEEQLKVQLEAERRRRQNVERQLANVRVRASAQQGLIQEALLRAERAENELRALRRQVGLNN